MVVQKLSSEEMIYDQHLSTCIHHFYCSLFDYKQLRVFQDFNIAGKQRIMPEHLKHMIFCENNSAPSNIRTKL